MNKSVVRVNLRENSEVFNSEFSVLSIVRNGKLEVGKPRNLINVPQIKLQGFQLRVFGFGYSAKWKTKSLKTSEFASEKTPRFSAPGSGYSAKWKTQSGKTDSLSFPSRLRRFDSDTCCELAKPKEGRLSKCLIHASRKSEKEKREKFLVIGATRCATKFKVDIY